MSVDNTNISQRFTMDNATAEFTFTFNALHASPEDIKCKKIDTNGSVSTLAYTTDYSVAVNVDGSGGVVTLVSSAGTDTLFVYRDTTDLQESDYEDYNQFPAETVETDLDRRTLKSQEQDEAITRAIKFPITSSRANIDLPTPVNGQVLVWSGTDGTLVNSEFAIVAAHTFGNITVRTKATIADLEATVANITGLTVGTVNITNMDTVTIGSATITTDATIAALNVSGATGLNTLNATTANITGLTVGTVNITNMDTVTIGSTTITTSATIELAIIENATIATLNITTAATANMMDMASATAGQLLVTTTATIENLTAATVNITTKATISDIAATTITVSSLAVTAFAHFDLSDDAENAWGVTQGANRYICVDTLNGSEAVKIGCIGSSTTIRINPAGATISSLSVLTSATIAMLAATALTASNIEITAGSADALTVSNIEITAGIADALTISNIEITGGMATGFTVSTILQAAYVAAGTVATTQIGIDTGQATALTIGNIKIDMGIATTLTISTLQVNTSATIAGLTATNATITDIDIANGEATALTIATAQITTLSAGTISGALTGDVTGDLAGNVEGNITAGSISVATRATIENATIATLTVTTKATIANAEITALSASTITVSTISVVGGQIAFPATAVPSADANTIDDYEEGTWTVVWSCSTSGAITPLAGTTTGAYTKIGRQVSISGGFNVDSVSSPTGTLTLRGLPFTSVDENSCKTAVAIYPYNLQTSAATSMVGDLANNSAYIRVSHFAAGVRTSSADDIKAGSQIVINATYFTT